MKTAKEDEQTNKDDTKKRSKPKKEPKSRKGAKSKPERSQNEIEPDQDTPDMLDKSVQTPRRYPCERINLTAKAELGKIADETLSEGMPVTDYLLVSMFIELLKSTPNMGGEYL
ncbi:hypothetical protein JTB14_005683 [Gonioctena quinquepunctata]|nr:hypothetical protein JTB14_005683 [Gonioctena quinquepunctata]